MRLQISEDVDEVAKRDSPKTAPHIVCFQADLADYLERASLYFTANAMDDDKKVPILPSSIGAPMYALLSDLLTPTPPGDKSFAKITAALQNHFEPKRSVFAERLRWMGR